MQPRGFTLIELMIVVAIIGILSALALPAYQDYTKRAHVAEALTLMSGLKTDMTEYFTSNGKWPSTIDSLFGTSAPLVYQGNAVEGILVHGSVISAYMDKNKFPPSHCSAMSPNCTLALRAITSGSGSIRWECGARTGMVGGASTTLPNKWLPANCRH